MVVPIMHLLLPLDASASSGHCAAPSRIVVIVKKKPFLPEQPYQLWGDVTALNAVTRRLHGVPTTNVEDLTYARAS